MNAGERFDFNRLLCKRIFEEKVILLIVIVHCLVLLIGCASRTKLKYQDRLAIRTVSISNSISLTEDMYYQGPKENILGVTFGVFSYPYIEDSKKRTIAIIKEVMSKNEIDVCDIVRNQFEHALEKRKMFIVSSSGYDAEFRLSIPFYGLGQTHGLSKQLKPLVIVRGTLFNVHEGRVVWERTASVTNLNGSTPSQTLEAYLKHPRRLEEAFRTASSIAAAELVGDMNRD